MSTATFPLTRVRALYTALGVPTAADWDAPTAASRLKTIGKLSDAVADVTDPALTALYDQIAKAVEDGAEIEVTDDAKAAPPKAKSGKGKAKGKEKAKTEKTKAAGKAKSGAAARRPGETEYERRERVWKEKWGETGQPVSDRGAGVTKVIIRELRAAGKGPRPAGITKEGILEVLKAEFPDRDPLKMIVTVGNQVPTRLRDERFLNVWKVDGDDRKARYFLRSDNKPQPREAVPPAARPGETAAGKVKGGGKTKSKAKKAVKS